MFRFFQMLALSAVLMSGLAPQIACFIQAEPAAQSEMDCCAKLTKDCGRMNMSCCPAPVRNDTGVVTRPVQDLLPHVHAVLIPVGITDALLAKNAANTPVQNNHAPPPDSEASSLVLRI
jgi:hypothetical protein